jgi:long-chain acyl-CoA synthetase
MLIELMNHPDVKKYDISSLVSIGGGGSAMPSIAVKKMTTTFPKAMPVQAYGLTEVNSGCTSNSGNNYRERPDSCGKAIPLVQIEIWKENDSHPETRKLPANVPGRVMIRGVTVMKEYWNKPNETAKVITPDGWFDSGDIGRLDEDGYLYIMDRAKDMIIRGGENISCAEVEAAVYHLPSVSEVAVFGQSHPILGEEVAVAVYLKPGTVTQLDLPTLTTGCEPHLAKFKVPSHLYILKEPLPKNATGKILKRELKSQLFGPKAKL